MYLLAMASPNSPNTSELSGFLRKFERSLEDDQISSLAMVLPVKGTPTRANMLAKLEETLKMTEESLDDLIKMLERINIGIDHIQKVSEFKMRHFWSESSNYTSTLGWVKEPISCKSHQASPIQSTSHEGESDQPPPAKRPKLGTSLQRDDSPDENEDEDEIEATLAIGNDKKCLERALEVAKKSNDPETKVGAILVNAHGEIVGEGYNDLPKKGLPWNSKAKNRWQTKTPYVTHAAVEAIDDARKKHNPTKDSILYTTSYPSARDGVRIYRAGIKEVVYMKKHKKWKTMYDTKATEILFEGEIITRKLHL